MSIDEVKAELPDAPMSGDSLAQVRAKENARSDIKKIWRKNGGEQHGPHVETFTIPEVDFYRFAFELIDYARRAKKAEPDGAVKGLPRADGNQADIGWTLPLVLLEELRTECQGWDDVSLECIESIALSVEARMRSALLPADGMREALEAVAAERRRQVEAEGWTAEHDARRVSGELAIAAACYALNTADDSDGPEIRFVGAELWPWSDEWWKPTDRRRDLIKAGALILAEIERLDRAALAGGQP